MERDRHVVVIAELEGLRSAPHHDLGELTDEERYAVAAGDHGVANRGPLRWIIDELLDHQRAVVRRERLQVERLDVIGIEVQRLTRGEQHQEAAERRTAHEPLYELECRGVGPMEVLDDDEEPLGVGQRVDPSHQRVETLLALLRRRCDARVGVRRWKLVDEHTLFGGGSGGEFPDGPVHGPQRLVAAQ